MRSTHATWDAAVAAAHAAADANGLPHVVLVGQSFFAVTRSDHIPPGQIELVAGVISPKEGS